MNVSFPRVTVLMPIYNAEKYLQAAIDSILSQSFKNFEFLIIDDGSTDRTAQIVQSYVDDRIRYIAYTVNLGIAHTLNRGLELSEGEYIVRMDSDDTCHRHRIERQVSFMDRHPRIGASGTWITFMGDQPGWVDRSPVGEKVVNAYLLLDNPMFHPSVILRRRMFHDHHLCYDPAFSRTEDYDLWSRAAASFPLDNLPEPLLKFRCHSASVTGSSAREMRAQTYRILGRELKRLRLDPSDEELFFHHKISRGYRLDRLESLARAENWFSRLVSQNKREGIFDEEAMAIAVGMAWFRLCRNSTPMGFSVLNQYIRSPLSGKYQPAHVEIWRFLMSLVWYKVAGTILERKNENAL